MAYPEGSVILHIGPHKTGTTTLQAAFHQNRDRLGEHGVHYVGSRAHSMIAAMAAASGKKLATSGLDAGADAWRALVDEVHASSARQIVLSSEFYSEAEPARIRAILDELGPERTHVVVTLRPLVRILASQWQQYMQNRPEISYDDDLDYPGWLDELLNRPAERKHGTPSFWRRHRHEELIEMWASVVGRDRLTIVVVDDADKEMLTRSFEELLTIQPGSLTPRELAANRSLTYPEIQLLTAFNRDYMARGYTSADYTRFVRFGSARYLQERRPAPDEARLLTPQWAVDRAAQLGRAAADAIGSSGVRVIGDLALLGDPTVASNVGDNDPGDGIPTAVVARFTAGLIKVAAELPASEGHSSRTPGPLETAVRRDKQQRRVVNQAKDLDKALVDARSDVDLVLLTGGLGRRQLARVLVGRIRRRLMRNSR